MQNFFQIVSYKNEKLLLKSYLLSDKGKKEMSPCVGSNSNMKE